MSNDLEDKVKQLGSKYDNLTVESAKVEDGQLVMKVSLRGESPLPDLSDDQDLLQSSMGDVGSISDFPMEQSNMRRITLDPLTRGDLDLAKASVLRSTPQELYQRSINYSRTKDIYGTALNILTNFASKGFENDIDDVTIKNFYDSWVSDSGFDDIVEKIFYDFFRVGMVKTYRILGQYVPKISYLGNSPGQKPPKLSEKANLILKEKSAPKNRWTNKFIPIAYTVLNPTYIDIKGSLMFGQTAVYLKSKAGDEIRDFLKLPEKQRTDFQKKILKSLPRAFLKAVENGQDIPLDPELVGHVDYRRMPYERYPLPRGIRAFDALDFKDELRKADISALDGLTSYILKITVGDKDKPATQEVLERVSEMFDTVSKSFKIVWNHTLQIEKITTPELGELLGPKKYEQVNSDLTGALGIVRALIDGTGNAGAEALNLAVKSIIEEINYARRQVERWIYNEYRAVAVTMGFDRIPKVRFDNMSLRDELQMMTIVQGMVDRRIISYRTGQELLGFDHKTELAQMKLEKPLVEDGTLGIVGSPYQRSRQDTQGTPSGTPSEGRPRGRPAPTPKSSNDPSSPRPKKKRNEEISSFLEDLTLDELESLLLKIKDLKNQK